MSLSVFSSPEVVKHTWYEVGSRRSIGGQQTVVAHEATKTRVVLSPEGQEKFTGDEDFAKLLGNWANLARHNYSLNPRTIVDSISGKTLQVSGPAYKGFGFNESSVYEFQGHEETIVKSFDHNPELAWRQFDVMQYIAKRLEIFEGENILTAPTQYALLRSRNRPRTTLFMQKVAGKNVDFVNRTSNPTFDLSQDPINKETMLSIKTQLKHAMSPLTLLANDLNDWNWFIDEV